MNEYLECTMSASGRIRGTWVLAGPFSRVTTGPRSKRLVTVADVPATQDKQHQTAALAD